MKKNIIFIFLIIFTPTISFAQNDTLLSKWFRSVGINDGRKVVVLTNIEKLASISKKEKDNYYVIKKGTFTAADSMAVEVNSNKQIIAIIISYNYEPEFSNDTAYIHELRKYRKLLNSNGTEYAFSSKQKKIKVTKWHDKKTIFEMVESIIDDKKNIYSIIYDKEQYYKKLSKRVDLNKNDNSIELLRLIGG